MIRFGCTSLKKARASPPVEATGLGSRFASRALNGHNRVVVNDEDGRRGNPAVQANRVGKGCGKAVNATLRLVATRRRNAGT